MKIKILKLIFKPLFAEIEKEIERKVDERVNAALFQISEHVAARQLEMYAMLAEAKDIEGRLFHLNQQTNEHNPEKKWHKNSK